MRGSGQRLPITLRFTRVLGTFSHTTCFPFSCALWACFSDRSVSGERSEPMGALMPHAALWVVQRHSGFRMVFSPEFQCRTRLCGWCSTDLSKLEKVEVDVSMPHAAIPFRPHHRFAVPLPRSRRGGLVTRRFLAESRNISFPRRCGGSGEHSEPIGALMPHAALWVVQPISTRVIRHSLAFQCRTRLCGWCNPEHSYVGQYVGVVSMPHAALWVVQRSLHRLYHSRDYAK